MIRTPFIVGISIYSNKTHLNGCQALLSVSLLNTDVHIVWRVLCCPWDLVYLCVSKWICTSGSQCQSSSHTQASYSQVAVKDFSFNDEQIMGGIHYQELNDWTARKNHRSRKPSLDSGLVHPETNHTEKGLLILQELMKLHKWLICTSCFILSLILHRQSC